MGWERGNTFNQGADGELIECVEKSGFCDNILFPHSASAPPGFSIRTPSANSSPALSRDGFSWELQQAPFIEMRSLGVGRVGWGGLGCCTWNLIPLSSQEPEEDRKPGSNRLNTKHWERHWKSCQPEPPAAGREDVGLVAWVLHSQTPPSPVSCVMVPRQDLWNGCHRG